MSPLERLGTSSPGRALEALRSGFWAVPTACVLVALALAVGLV